MKQQPSLFSHLHPHSIRRSAQALPMVVLGLVLLAGAALTGCDPDAAAPTADAGLEAGTVQDSGGDRALADRGAEGLRLDGLTSDQVALDRMAADGTVPDGQLPGDAGSDSAPDSGASDGAALDSQLPDQGLPTVTPQWIVHLTDTHIGASSFASKALTEAVQQVLPTIAPTATILSGDVTEGGQTSEWTSYEALIKGKVPAYPAYLEIIGNHDMKTSNGSPFIKSSQTGKAGGGLYGMSYPGPAAGALRVVRTNTADSTNGTSQLLGYFGSTQKANLLATKPPSGTTLAHTVVTGHHPVVGLIGLPTLGTDSAMKDLFTKVNAEAYLCGHVHTAALAWVGQTLMVQTPTLGKPNILSTHSEYAIIGLDSTGPSLRKVSLGNANSLKASWPVVLVTTPAQADLGGKNPLIKAVPAGKALVVRALGFSPKGVTTMELRLDSGAWTAMTASGKPLWQATVTAPSTTGNRTLEVKATSPEGTDTHKISVLVGI